MSQPPILQEPLADSVTLFSEIIFGFENPALQNLNWKSKPNWTVEEIEFKIKAALVNDSFIFLKINGSARSNAVKSIATILRDVLDATDNLELPLVIDASNANKASWKARREIRMLYEELKPRLGHFFYKINPRIRGYFKIYHTFFPERARHTTIVNSIEDAFNTIIEDNPIASSGMLVERVNEYQGLNRAQLMQVCKKLESQLVIRKAHEEEFKENLFKVISQITWDDDFKPQVIESKVKEYSGIYSALNILQEDVYEIIQRLKKPR
ncbi:MAG: hypothetical protein RJQ09_09180 [Cyclobacteriaceae bacterium]